MNIKNKIFKPVFLACLSCLLFGCEPWQYAEKGTVIEIGNTHGGEGFFSGNVETACRIEWEDGTISSMPVYGNIMVGTVVWKHCWEDEEGIYCYSTASTNNRGCKFKKGYKYYPNSEQSK